LEKVGDEATIDGAFRDEDGDADGEEAELGVPRSVKQSRMKTAARRIDSRAQVTSLQAMATTSWEVMACSLGLTGK
jgi:hypothetical protein